MVGEHSTPAAQAAPREGRARATAARPAALVALVAAVALSGSACGADAERQAAGDIALRFARAAHDNPRAACALLSPETRRKVEVSQKTDCPSALKEADLPDSSALKDVTVAGQAAQAVLDGDVLFLGLFTDGWRVVGAGCHRAFSDPAKPYDCDIARG